MKEVSIKNVGIVGAGIMGPGIAEVFAVYSPSADCSVVVYDPAKDALDKARERVEPPAGGGVPRAHRSP